jgi:hypothetical protein
LAWSQADAGVQEAMIWFSESGVVRLEQTVPLSESEALFVYVRGNEVVLVCHPVVYHADSQWHGLVVHRCDHNGAPLASDTLFEETFPLTAFVGQSAFALRGNELIAGMMTGEGSPSPTHYLRVVRHWPDSTIVGEPNLCAFPGGSYVNAFALSTGPSDRAVAALGVFRSDTTELHYTGLEEEAGTDRWHMQRLLTGQSLTAVSLTWHGATVYSAYTTNSLTSPQDAGAYLLAFPLDQILAADEPPPPIPHALALGASPNPFNSSTRLTFSLARSGNALLDVFDVTGRLVERSSLGRRAAGDHAILWNAPSLPSGIYFARLQAGSQNATTRLLLIR